MLLNESPTITRQHYRILGLSWAGWVFDFYDLILFTFLLIMIRQDFHLTNMEISYILGASLAATAVGGIFFGVLADKYGRKPVTKSALWGRRPAYTLYSFIMAAGLLMITLFWSTVVTYPPVILGFMFLVGFGTGMFGGYGALFSELFPTSIRSTAMGTAFNLARGVQFITPVIITVVAVNYGLSGGISLAALFAILTGLWIWTFPETRGKKLEE